MSVTCNIDDVTVVMSDIFIPPYGSMGVFSFYCMFAVCTVTNFSAAEKRSGVKFCMHVPLLPGQVFSHFGQHWLAWSHGGRITSGMSCIQIVLRQSELGAAASRKAVWWDLRLASPC